MSGEAGAFDLRAVPRPRRARLNSALAAVTGEPAWLFAQADELHLENHCVVLGRSTDRRYGNQVNYRVGGGAEAWEALATAELIPFAWMDEPDRRFLHYASRSAHDCPAHSAWGARNRPPHARGERCFACGFYAPHLRPQPGDVPTAVALAADVPGVLTTEALARELVATTTGLQTRVLAWHTERAWDAIARCGPDPLHRVPPRWLATTAAPSWAAGYVIDALEPAFVALAAPPVRVSGDETRV